MAIREIPKSYEYTCDFCGAKHLQENAGGHYPNSVPPEWMRLKIWSDLVMPAPEKMNFPEILLCTRCSHMVVEFIQSMGERAANTLK